MEMASLHWWRWLRGKRAARQQNTDTDYLNPKDESVQSCAKIRKKNGLGQKINTLKLLLRHHSLLVYLVCWIWEQFLARVRDGVSMWNCKCFNPFISFFKKTQLKQFRSSCCHMLKYRILQNKNYTQKKALMFHNTLVSNFESKRKLVWTLRNKEVTLLVFGKIQLVVYYQCWVLIGWATTGLYVIVP